MQNFKHFFFAALFTLTAFSIITYMSCSVDKCKNVACVNTGACQDGKCICPSTFTGEHCEIIKDPCASITCQHGGTCSSGICTCPLGYSGTYCEVEDKVRDKFIGTWQGSDVCGTNTYNIIMTGTAYGDVSLHLQNPSGFGASVIITCDPVDATHMSFSNQNVGGGAMMTGTLTLLTSTTLKIEYTASDATGTINCVGNYTKQ